MNRILIVLVGALVASSALASESINVSLVPDVAIHGRNVEIRGLALSVWGENPQSAFALGFVNGSTGQSQGLSVGMLNYSDGY
jgi:hypothetical protein